ncbi:MAG: Uncharacterised protein [Cryomorphaceae bacterium]|nr:MAG: Uncharacterised protein [Cryomorphaceae bacterium]
MDCRAVRGVGCDEPVQAARLGVPFADRSRERICAPTNEWRLFESLCPARGEQSFYRSKCLPVQLLPRSRHRRLDGSFDQFQKRPRRLESPSGPQTARGRAVAPRGIGGIARCFVRSAFGHHGKGTSGHHRTDRPVCAWERTFAPHRLPLQCDQPSGQDQRARARNFGNAVPECTRRTER